MPQHVWSWDENERHSTGIRRRVPCARVRFHEPFVRSQMRDKPSSGASAVAVKTGCRAVLSLLGILSLDWNF